MLSTSLSTKKVASLSAPASHTTVTWERFSIHIERCQCYGSGTCLTYHDNITLLYDRKEVLGLRAWLDCRTGPYHTALLCVLPGQRMFNVRHQVRW
jgi:hypothetical protein